MHIYFLGIGGVAMGPLARIARDIGYNVSGSDLVASRYTESVKNDGIPVEIGSSAENIAGVHSQRPIDWVVYSAAVPINSSELQFARDRGIRTSKRDIFINHVLKNKELSMIAISGTHGKTSTTGMTIWMCKQLEIPISYSIGTNISFGPNGKYEPDSKFFIYEADEFDRNFIKFDPEFSIIPSLDYDHPDTYDSVDDYKEAFRDFVNQSGKTYTWKGVGDYLDLGASDKLALINDEDNSIIEQIHLPGHHNRRNASLVIELLHELLDVAKPKLIDAINTFPGTERRMEKITENLYSDYAHHPEEIRATIQAVKELNPRVVVVYQPHQNRRQLELKDKYRDCFEGVEKVFWLPTYLSRESAENIVSADELIRGLSNPQIAEKADMNDDLYGQINHFRTDGALVIAMAAGDLDAWVRDQFKIS
jgi:UDP-N-acetylmuramate--alanine ligase